MNREFLDLYNRELKLLYEQAREFADEYPGIAERLGGLLEDRIDPLIGGLLEGAAFLAARVQLKLKHEFPEFTNNLLEHLFPHYLAPTPSMMLSRSYPEFGDKALRDGQPIPRGSYLDAAFRQLDRQIACRYRLCGDITIWPFEFDWRGVFFFSGATAGARVVGGPRRAGWHPPHLHPSAAAANLEDEPPDNEAFKKPEMMFAGCRTTNLPLYFVGPEADAVALYEQLFAHCRGIYFRCLDSFGDPVVHPAPAECFIRSASSAKDALFPNDHRVFEGFDLLREYFYVSAQVPRLQSDSPG